MALWRYSDTIGEWRRERDTTPETARDWLDRFRRDEPTAIFAVHDHKPAAKHTASTFGRGREIALAMAEKLNAKL